MTSYLLTVTILSPLIAAMVLLVYLWLNPLFLPVGSFFGGPTTKKGGSSFGARLWRRAAGARSLPKHKRESLQVDAILEKIGKSGFDSLTEEEKRVLGEVSDKYQRRAESKKPESGLAI